MKKYVVGVVGASGAVGEEIFKVLEERKFPISRIIPLASERSVGKEIEFDSQVHKIRLLTHDIFEQEGIEIAFFSAGGSVSAEYAPSAAKAGAVVIDNTSHFRQDPEVPLVVPEVNSEDIALWNQKGIIANPNCSTIQMVQVLAPLHKIFEIERIDVSTYQAASGAGKGGIEELVTQMQAFFAFNLNEAQARVFPHRLALNVIPHIDAFMPNNYTKEEMKMVNETHKIMHSDFAISATCVRVPVIRSHSESITVRFKNKVSAQQARDVLSNVYNVVVADDPSQNLYPMPILATDTEQTYVGRIREDNFDSHILHLWCSADQLRVGAATNAVRIAQRWVKMQNSK